ncbi:ethanolamine ammonia-lyase subunit EutC [Salimicrobium album]|uniref:Ethanolamine ammonia-lyase small subunit n=1 Tax=Salimicrobium album TaxID=50717 RepID=A0A1H3FSZ1_9BACI|nr:ethanolamine ammonia-lyase subunit EutC [Salimicrobium album]SDX93965.1 Ethanolamine ammonia-lyase light chain [Salimicrobium album]
MNIEQIVEEVLSEMGRSEKAEEKHLQYEQKKEVTVADPVSKENIEYVQRLTPARIGIGRAGTRMRTKNYLDFRVDHAAAQDAVFKDVEDEVIEQMGLSLLKSRAVSMQEYLMNLDAGRKLDDASADWLKNHAEKGKQVQIIVSDGLSSTGVEETVPDLYLSLTQGLESKNITVGTPVFIRKSRVWIQDEVAALTDCELVISLIGERPGLATSKSISAYIIYKPGEESVEADRTVFSNIHEGGVPPVEAGAYLADVIERMLENKASGVAFARLK